MAEMARARRIAHDARAKKMHLAIRGTPPTEAFTAVMVDVEAAYETAVLAVLTAFDSLYFERARAASELLGKAVRP